MSHHSSDFTQTGESHLSDGRPVPSILLTNGVTPAELRRALRGHSELFLVAVGLTLALVALLIFGSPPQYSARATIRMASERRTLTSGVEDAPQALDRPVDPLLSAVQVLTSRTLVGAVADSLGLRLQPLGHYGVTSPLFGGRLRAGALQRVSVDSAASSDTLLLQFTDTDVIARSRTDTASARLGKPLLIGGVRLTASAIPPARFAVLEVAPRDIVIDDAIRRLKVVPRPGTDVIDVKYVDTDPARAQQFANHLARLFQTANGHSAQEQARRRREFLGDQLRVTDSMLLEAEEGLSAFRSRQQMGSSRDNLSAEQANAATLESRRAELRADRRVFAALLERIKNAGGSQDAGFRALAYST